MKKLRYLIFLSIIFLTPSVFAQNVTSSVRCSYNGSGSTYYGDPNDGFNSARCYDLGSRYSPRLGYISFYLPTSAMSFSANTSYTVTMNMATNDWRNNIMLQNVRYVNASGSVITSSSNLPTMTNFRFISRKQIKFDFKLPNGTVYPYLRFVLSSPTYGNPDPDISSSTYMTGDSNWNLSSIDISPVSTSSGGSSGGTSGGSYDDSGIINNNNSNTSDIINNNNSNTQQILDSQKDIQNSLSNCSGNKDNLLLNTTWSNGYIYNGNVGVATTNTLSDYILIDGSKQLTITTKSNFYNIAYALYTSNKTFINAYDNYQSNRVVVNVPSNARYIRVWFNYNNSTNTINTISNYEVNMYNYYCSSKIDDTTNAINDVNNSINNSNVDNGVGSGFFSDFNSQDFGLSQIITIPLNTIQSLTSKSCVPLQIPIPFTNSNVTLPCMTEIYETKFPTIYNLWKIVSFGIVAYLIAIDIFHMVKGFKDPESDKVEVLDL